MYSEIVASKQQTKSRAAEIQLVPYVVGREPSTISNNPNLARELIVLPTVRRDKIRQAEAIHRQMIQERGSGHSRQSCVANSTGGNTAPHSKMPRVTTYERFEAKVANSACHLRKNYC